MSRNLDLFIFQSKLASELERADEKHGRWAGKDLEDMLFHITDELNEVCDAYDRGDIEGEHGMKAELIQVATTCFKMWREL